MIPSLALQLSAEALAEILVDGVIAVDTALAAQHAGVDLNSLIALGALTQVEMDRVLEEGDEPVFDMTPAGYAVVDIDDDGSIH